ncbi:hypothetical protein V5O48_014576 [Marasmius crinis-equi]|uniref:Uncharacterized protein n=1 Tax=Marasmius crinis-equi TaxID=585013 RepID=A0ABR3EWX1_9AGAR
MTHLKLNCTGNCLLPFAATLDIQSPASDVPHGTITFNSDESETFYALAARVTPRVLDACRCPDKVEHRADIIWVGNILKLRRWGSTRVPCGCPEFLFMWDVSTSKCMWGGYMVWCRLRDEYDEAVDEAELDIDGGDLAATQHRKRRDMCLELDVDCFQA